MGTKSHYIIIHGFRSMLAGIGSSYNIYIMLPHIYILKAIYICIIIVIHYYYYYHYYY